MLLEEFKRHCITLRSDILVQKYLIENETHFFLKNNERQEFDFKKDIASSLNVHIRDVVIVGSGKLGFSIKPEEKVPGLYLFKEFDFGKKSDLDVAIVSSWLFDREIIKLYNHTFYYKDTWPYRNSFAQYVLKGRLASRYLPSEFSLTKEIAQIQEKYQMEYGREINIEIYKSWHYFETYHQENIKNIQVNLIR